MNGDLPACEKVLELEPVHSRKAAGLPERQLVPLKEDHGEFLFEFVFRQAR